MEVYVCNGLHILGFLDCGMFVCVIGCIRGRVIKCGKMVCVLGCIYVREV